MFLFVARHAESETSRDNWQTPDSKLSSYGMKQAEALGERLKLYEIDQIFSSDWKRSKQTSEIISNSLNVKFEPLDYLHEREQLPEIYGAKRDSDISKEYLKEYYANFRNLDWKFKDKEESVREVLNRTTKFLDFLVKNYKSKRVLLISHDIFIRCLIANVLLGSNYSDESMARIIKLITISNTGLSLLIHDSKTENWSVNYINNYSHLRGIERK